VSVDSLDSLGSRRLINAILGCYFRPSQALKQLLYGGKQIPIASQRRDFGFEFSERAHDGRVHIIGRNARSFINLEHNCWHMSYQRMTALLAILFALLLMASAPVIGEEPMMVTDLSETNATGSMEHPDELSESDTKLTNLPEDELQPALSSIFAQTEGSDLLKAANSNGADGGLDIGNELQQESAISQGGSGDIEAFPNNRADQPVSGTLELLVDQNGDDIFDADKVIDSKQANLSAGEFSTESLTYSDVQLAPEDYKYQAQLNSDGQTATSFTNGTLIVSSNNTGSSDDGNQSQAESLTLHAADVPETVQSNSTFSATYEIENTGQATTAYTVEMAVDRDNVTVTGFSGDIKSSAVDDKPPSALTDAIAVGARAEVTINYQVTADTTGNATLTATARNPQSGASTTLPQNISIQTVTEPAAPVFSVTSINAPDEVTAGDEVEVSANIENTGDASGSQVVSFIVDGDREENRSIDLAPGESTTAMFSYSISDDATSQIDEIIVETSNSTLSTSIRIRGTLDRTPLSLEANQTALVRGETVRFTVTDDTGSPINATVLIAGTAQQTGSDGTATVTVDITGRFEAVAIKEPTNDTEFAPATLSLSVSNPTLSIGQSAVAFGDVAVGELASTQVTINNTASTAISIDSLRVSGPNADAFSLGAAALPDEIPANTDRTVNLTFEPSSSGAATATVTINEQTVNLSGTGTAPELSIDTELPIEITTDPGTTASASVSITNLGNAPLTADLTSGDRFTQPDTLSVDAGETETFDVEFTPRDGDSAVVSTRLTIAPESEALSERLIPVVGTVIDRDIRLQRSETDFGNVTVGEPTTAGIVVENPGTTTESLSTTTEASEFELAPEDQEFTLAPDETAFLNVEAVLTDPGVTTSTLTVETEDGAVSDTATLTATGQTPEVSVASAEPLSFGTTPLNSTTSRAVEIVNDGNAPLTVAVDGSLNDSAFRPVGPTELEIPAGESRNLPIGFTPQTTGETTADLILRTNDPATPQLSLTLKGESIATDVGLSPSTVSFGTVGVSSSTTRTVALENDGSAFTINNISVESAAFDSASDLSGTTVSEGETINISLVFDPETSGSQTGTMTVSGSTDTESTDVSAALTGTGQRGDLQLSSRILRTGVTVADETTTGAITIRNTGLAGTQLTIDDVELSDTDQFSLSTTGVSEGTTIAGQSSRAIVVTFNPTTTEDGTQETPLTLEASSGEETFTRTISVTGTVSAPDPTVSTDALSIGTLSVGDTVTRTVTVSNTGGEPFTITSVTSETPGVTAQQPGSSEVVPGGESTVAIEVNRSTAGSIDSTIDIATTATEDSLVRVTGDVIAPEFSLTTETIDFGESPTESTSQQTVTIENVGGAPLRIASPTISGPDAGAFTILSGDRQLRIAGGSSETLTLGFSPDTTGEQTATLTINPRNDPTADAQEITLTGTGTESDVGLNQSAIGFGSLQPRRTQSQSLELTNDGSASVEITSASVTGSDSEAVSVNGLQKRILDPGESESFNVEVDTAGVSRGRLTAQVDITTTDTTVTSSVGATVASPDISVTSRVEADAFGSTRVGGTSTASIQINNPGNAELTLDGLSTTGSDAAAFSIVDQPTGPISPQSSGRIEIEFDPAALPNAADRAQNTPLEATAQLEIQNNAGSTQSVSLSGEAETGALTTPLTFQFGTTPIGEATTRQISIANSPSATAPITITGLGLSGANADEYGASLSETTLPVSLAPGQSTIMNVSLTPASLEKKFATASIQTDDPRQPVQKIGMSNSETIYRVDYGSVAVQYINPTRRSEPTVDVDRGLQNRNATLTQTSADVNTMSDYALNYTFGTTPSEIGGAPALRESGTTDIPIQYMNATTTAEAADFNESTFQIEVSKAVLATQDTTPENVTIYHEVGDSYEPLETTRLFETKQGYIYEVTTDSYSAFAVGAAPDNVEDGTDDGDGGGGGGGGGGGDGGDGGDGDGGSGGGGGGGGGDGGDGDGGDGGGGGGDGGDGGDGTDGGDETQATTQTDTPTEGDPGSDTATETTLGAESSPAEERTPTVEQSPTPPPQDTETPGESGPGFGVVIALLSILLVIIGISRQHNR